MAADEQYRQAFIEAFEAEDSQLDDLEYQGIDNWDSVGHMMLISILEEQFNIMMEMDDIIDFSSFQKGKEILAKYGIALD